MHTYHFRQFLGHNIPPHLHTLFSTLEAWRQRGGARPLLIVEQGDQEVRPYLEQYMRYRLHISQMQALVISDEPYRRPFLRHPRLTIRPSTIHPDSFRGLTHQMVMLLDTQEYRPYANPLRRDPNRFPRYYPALHPATSERGFYIVHIHIDRTTPITDLLETNLATMVQLIHSLDPPPSPPPRKVTHPPIPPHSAEAQSYDPEDLEDYDGDPDHLPPSACYIFQYHRYWLSIHHNPVATMR